MGAGLDEPERTDEPEPTVEALYRAQWSPMVRLAWLMLGSREAAEDVVQDAFIRVASSWERVLVPDAYLRSAVVNSARDHTRRVRRELAYVEQARDPVLPAELSHMWELVQQLPDRQRHEVVLRFYLDLDFRQVAALLNCRSSTARSLVRRGLQSLRKDFPWA
jgi:RNA polymerase sigma factor (sigma-70 family)